MDKVSYEKAIALAKEIELYEIIRKRIRDSHLGFDLLSYRQRELIQDILSKHEAEIRQEIDDRYNELKKQIEEL